MELFTWLKNLWGRMTGTRRKCIYTKGTHEYHNSCFTDLQHIQKRVEKWDLQEKSEQVPTVRKLEMLITYENMLQQKDYTRWFIGLTLINISVLIISILVTFWWQFC